MISYAENKQLKQSDLSRLYTSVGWSSYTSNPDLLEKAFIHSLATITAWEHEQLIGLIRVVGDGYTIIYIQDILIHPDFQNQNVGTHLMSKILSKYKNVRQKVLLTDEAIDVRHFYEKFDFASCDRGKTVAFYREF